MREVAKALLAAAGNPYLVQSITTPHQGFLVPADVFERFEQLYNNETDATSDVQDQAPVPPRKPRGRPRKNTGKE